MAAPPGSSVTPTGAPGRCAHFHHGQTCPLHPLRKKIKNTDTTQGRARARHHVCTHALALPGSHPVHNREGRPPSAAEQTRRNARGGRLPRAAHPPHSIRARPRPSQGCGAAATAQPHAGALRACVGAGGGFAENATGTREGRGSRPCASLLPTTSSLLRT